MYDEKGKFSYVGAGRNISTAGREGDVPGYVWYGYNRVREKHASGVVK